MKIDFPLVTLMLIVLTACSLTGEPIQLQPEAATQPFASGKCGDGVLDALEQADPDRCPQDATAVRRATSPGLATAGGTPGFSPGESVTVETIPPLYFLYTIHVHIAGADYAPYSDESMTHLDTDQAANMAEIIDGIAAVLDAHGVKGTWQVVYGTSHGLCNWQGEDNIFQRLNESGHEVGIHIHAQEDIQTAYNNLRMECDITPRTVSGFLTTLDKGQTALAHQVYIEDITIAQGLGMHTAIGNVSPLDTSSPFGELCANQIGLGNDMWAQTGNLLFPWIPDAGDENFCWHDPMGDFVFIDHVSASWMLAGTSKMPDTLGDLQFTYLRQYLDGALEYMETNRPERVAVWGFVTHIIEYAPGSLAESPPDPASLAALDAFLDYVENRAEGGCIVFATASEIAEAAYP